MSKLEQTVMIVASTLLPVAARAHPGPHRESLELSLRHAFTEPEHLLTMTWIGSWCAMAICVVFWFKPWQKYSWVRSPDGAPALTENTGL